MASRRRQTVERFWTCHPWRRPVAGGARPRGGVHRRCCALPPGRDHDRGHRAMHQCRDGAAHGPAVATSVAEIVVMGGAIRVPGLVTPAVEFNLGYDPESVAVVLASGAPVTLVPLDVTTRTLMLPEHIERLAARNPPASLSGRDQPPLAPVCDSGPGASGLLAARSARACLRPRPGDPHPDADARGGGPGRRIDCRPTSGLP